MFTDVELWLILNPYTDSTNLASLDPDPYRCLLAGLDEVFLYLYDYDAVYNFAELYTAKCEGT